MPERALLIRNKLGLHARASAKLVETAGRYISEITLSKDGITVNAKSILGIMMLAAHQGSTVILQAEGHDAEVALDALEDLIAERFGEAE